MVLTLSVGFNVKIVALDHDIGPIPKHVMQIEPEGLSLLFPGLGLDKIRKIPVHQIRRLVSKYVVILLLP